MQRMSGEPMVIKDFISRYRNHPVLFIGTGISLRYLNNSYAWPELLKKVAYELKGNTEYYLDLKSDCDVGGKCDFAKVAQILEEDFHDYCRVNRHGKFKSVNDQFYQYMEKGIKVSRFKIYITQLLESIDVRSEKIGEIAEFKKIRKNIGSIITTNYDTFVESVFEFEPLIGNDILLSNPYGSVYKIHGCVSHPSKIVITSDDYNTFNEKYDLIRAQLLSLFIHNPIIFMGYSISDENIKNLLKTIFTYVEASSEEASLIKDNFLLIEYEENSTSHDVVEHDIDIEGLSTIRINKVKTDDYLEIYKCLSKLTLPISAMDVRKVQNIVKEIYAGGNIKVNITENLDSLRNSDKIIAIGSDKTIRYEFQNIPEMMTNYFTIMEESNSQLLALINKFKISKTQYFPIFGFSQICETIGDEIRGKLKEQQKVKITTVLETISDPCKTHKTSIIEILSDDSVTPSNKINAIFWSTIEQKISLDDVEKYLKEFNNKSDSSYRKLLCAYDFVKYGP